MFIVLFFMLSFHSPIWKIFDGSRKTYFPIIEEGGENFEERNETAWHIYNPKCKEISEIKT